MGDDVGAAAGLEAPRHASLDARLAEPRTRAAALAVLVLLSLVASATSLWNGFAYDDRWIIVENATVTDSAHWWFGLSDSYWPAFRNAALFRPFAVVGYALQWAAGDGAPWVFHAVNVLLYAVVTLLVYALAVELLPRMAAWVAAALFAVHPVHVEAVGNVVGQAELWTSAVVLLALITYLRARRGGAPLPRQTGLFIALCYLVGMCFKENAIVLPALIAAAEAFCVRDTRASRRRADELVTFLVWLGLVAALYLAVRVYITGAVGGDVEHPALRGLGVWQRTWVMIALAPEFARLLIWPQHLSADYSPRHVPYLPSPSVDHAPGLLLLVCLVVLAVVARRRWPLVTFALAWIAVTLTPTANIAIPTGILLAERTLFLPSVAAVLAAAALVPWVASRLASQPRSLRILGAAPLVLLLGVGAAHSAERQRVWKDSDTVFRQMQLDAPQSFKTHYAGGGLLWEQRRAAEAEREWRYAIALFPQYWGVRQDLAHRYRDAHVCQAAIPLYLEALAIEQKLPYSWVGLAACHLELAQYRKARAVARRAYADTMYKRAFQYIITRADSALIANDTLDGANRWRPGIWETLKRPAVLDARP